MTCDLLYPVEYGKGSGHHLCDYFTEYRDTHPAGFHEEKILALAGFVEESCHTRGPHVTEGGLGQPLGDSQQETKALV